MRALRRCGMVLSIGLMLCPRLSYCQATDTISNPEAFDILLLCYVRAGVNAPFDLLAKEDPTVQRADEFRQPQAIAAFKENLNARLARLKAVKFLIVNLNTTFGEYDEKYKEFDFPLTNGAVVSYSRMNEQAQLALTNAGMAAGWKLNPREAQETLDRAGGNRSVVLVMTVQILDAPPPAEESTVHTLNARIVGFDIVSANNVRLGHVSVSP